MKEYRKTYKCVNNTRIKMHAKRIRNIAYDYKIIIVIRGYGIYIVNEIKETDCLLRT